MATPLVSVIVPCFNYGHYLAETLESVSRQTHSDLECIIVDDGSTDNTEAVADEFVRNDKRFRYIYQDNQGLSAARNTGIKNSNGEWLQFLDADDLIHHRKLELQLKYASSAGVVFSNYKYFKEKAVVDALVSMESTTFPEPIPFMLRQNITVVNGAIVRTSAIADTLFDTNYKSLEDWHFWLRLAIKGVSFARVWFDKPVVFVRQHNISMSTNRPRMLAAHGQLLAFMKEHFSKYNLSEESKYFRGGLIFDEIENGSASAGLKLALKEMLKRPSNISWILRNTLYSLKVSKRK